LTSCWLRGGSWLGSLPVYFRAAFRCRGVPDDRYLGVGFRVVLCSQKDLNP